MMLGPLFISIEGKTLSKKDKKNLKNRHVGGVILFSKNYENKSKLKKLTDSIRAIKSPELIICVDQEGGRIQRFLNEFYPLPSLRSIGKLYDKSKSKGLESAFLSGQIMSLELSEMGIDFSFSPVLDIDHGYSDIIGDRSFHSDPNIVSKLATEYINGIRSFGMISVGKHFPGHGGVILDSHEGMPIDHRSMKDLQKDLKPYINLSNSHLNAIMTAHIQYPNIDDNVSTFSEYWLKDILRKELGFDGLIFSDDLTMKALDKELTITEKIDKALLSGCDFILVCNIESEISSVLESLEIKYDRHRIDKKNDILRCKILPKKNRKKIVNKQVMKLNALLDR